MRRLLCIMLAAVLFVGSLNVPAYSEELIEEMPIEVIDESVVEAVETTEPQEEMSIDISDENAEEISEVTEASEEIPIDTIDENVEEMTDITEPTDEPIVDSLSAEEDKKEELTYPGEFVDVEEDRIQWGESFAPIHILCPDIDNIIGYRLNVTNYTKSVEVSQEVYISEENISDNVIEINLYDTFGPVNDPQIYSDGRVCRIMISAVPILAEDCGYILKENYDDFKFTYNAELSEEEAGKFIISEEEFNGWNYTSAPIELYCPNTELITGYKIVLHNSTLEKYARTTIAITPEAGAQDASIFLDLIKDEAFASAKITKDSGFTLNAMPILKENSGYILKKSYESLIFANNQLVSNWGKLVLTEEDYEMWNNKTGAPVRVECPDRDKIIGYKFEVRRITGVYEQEVMFEDPSVNILVTDLSKEPWTISNLYNSEFSVSITPIFERMSGYIADDDPKMTIIYPFAIEDVGKIVVKSDVVKLWNKESSPLQIVRPDNDMIVGYEVTVMPTGWEFGLFPRARKQFYFEEDAKMDTLEIDIMADMLEDSQMKSEYIRFDATETKDSDYGWYYRADKDKYTWWEKDYEWLVYENVITDSNYVTEKFKAPLLYDFAKKKLREFKISAVPILKENSGYQVKKKYDSLIYEYDPFASTLPEDTVIYTDPDEAFEEMRRIHRERLTTQKGGYVMYVDTHVFIEGTPLLDIIFDKYSEREGMRPDEGDYLWYCSASRTDKEWNEVVYTIDTKWIGDQEVYKIVFTTPFITTAAEEKEVDNKVNQILNGPLANVKNASNEAKAKAAFNWIVNNVQSSGGDRTEPLKHTAYNAFINGNATCQGYALAYGRLLRELGVPNKVIMGTDANAHTYNIVLMDKEADGKQYYYYVDPSMAIFKKDYTSFSRTEEQDHYKTPGFIANYMRKVKGYYAFNKEAVAEVLDDNGKVIYAANTLLDARMYIITETERVLADNEAEEKRRKTKQEKDVFYDPDAEEPLTVPRYTLRLLKNLSSVSKGDLDYSDFSEGDNTDSSNPYLVNWKYGKYVSLDLNGYTLNVKGNSFYYIRTGAVKNGTIKINAGTKLYLLSDGDIGIGENSIYSNVSFVGVNSSDTINVMTNVAIDDTCSVSSISNGFFDNYSSVATDVNFKKCTVQAIDTVDFKNVITDTLELQGDRDIYWNPESSVNDSYVETLNVDSLTVNTKTTVVGRIRIKVKDFITLNGSTTCNRNTDYGWKNFAEYGFIQLQLLKAADGNIAQMNIAGSYDNRYREERTDLLEYTRDMEVKPIRVDVIDPDGTVAQIPVNAVLGTLSGVQAYIPTTEGNHEIGSMVAVNNENVGKIISLNPYVEKEEEDEKYSYQSTANQKLDLSGITLSYADLMEGEVSGGAENANYRVTYIKEGATYNRHYETIEKAIGVIEELDSELDESEPENTQRDYTLTILQKKENIDIDELPEFTNANNDYSLNIKGKDTRSVYIKDISTYPLYVDIVCEAKSCVYTHNFVEDEGMVWPQFIGDTRVRVYSDVTGENYVKKMILHDNARLIVDAPLSIETLEGGDNVSVELSETIVDGISYFGKLTVDDVVIKNRDESEEGSIDLVDKLKYTYRAQNQCETVLIISDDDFEKIDYVRTTPYGQHLICSALNTYDVVAGISAINCKGIVKLTNKDKSTYNGIKQEIDTTEIYNYSLQKEEESSTDELQAESSKPDWVYAVIDSANKTIQIETKLVPAKEQASKITVKNKITDETVLEFYVTTVNPSWENVSPTVSLSSSSDIDFTFKLTPPKGLTLTDDYYYGIRLEPLQKNGSAVMPGTQVNTEEYFVKANGATQASVYAFAEEGNLSSKVNQYGDGIASKMNAFITVYLTNDGKEPHDLDNPELTNVVIKTIDKKVKKLSNIATKTPYYANKISLKKGTVSVYPGQSNVKIANVVFDKKVTFIGKDFWQPVCETPGITVSQGTEQNDTGVYVTLDDDVLPGVYTIGVNTEPAAIYAAGSNSRVNNYVSASIKITVPNYISRMQVEVGKSFAGEIGGIYRAKGAKKALSVKADIKAFASDNSLIKKPKVSCTIMNADETSMVSNEYMKADSNGKINITKDCPKGDYVLLVQAMDYVGNSTTCKAKFRIIEEISECATIELWDYSNNDGPVKIDDSASEIKADSDIRIKAVDDKGNDLDPATYTVSMTSGFLAQNPGMFVKTGNATYTVQTISGKKVTRKIKVVNADGSRFGFKIDCMGEHSELKPIEFTEDTELSTDKDKIYVCDISDIKYLSLGEVYDATMWYENEQSRYFGRPSSETVTDIAMSLKNINKLSNTKNQSIKFRIKGKEAEITLKWKEEGIPYTRTYKIMNNNFNNITAPKASLNGKVYSDYLYKNGENLKFTLKLSRDFVPATIDSVKPSLYQTDLQGIIYDDVFEIPKISIEEVNNKEVWSLCVPIKNDVRFIAGKSYKFVYDFYDVDGYSVMNAPLEITVKPAKFNQSFKLTSSYKLKLGDVATVTGKGTGVEDIEFETYLLNGNDNGEYNDFNKIFKISSSGEISYTDAALGDTTLIPQNKGKYKTVSGYVTYTITYESGICETRTEMIKVSPAM